MKDIKVVMAFMMLMVILAPYSLADVPDTYPEVSPIDGRGLPPAEFNDVPLIPPFLDAIPKEFVSEGFVEIPTTFFTLRSTVFIHRENRDISEIDSVTRSIKVWKDVSQEDVDRAIRFQGERLDFLGEPDIEEKGDLGLVLVPFLYREAMREAIRSAHLIGFALTFNYWEGLFRAFFWEDEGF